MASHRSAKRAAQTRAFYAFEDQHMPEGRPILTQWHAQRIATRVWEWAKTQERYRKRARAWRVPTILFGPGVKQNGRWLSYCEGHLKIVLSPDKRCMTVLLHELTHALGPATHGKRFQELYLSMTLQFLV